MGKILVGHKWVEEAEYLKELNPAGSSGFMQSTNSDPRDMKAPPGTKAPPSPEPKKQQPSKPRVPQTEWASGDSASEPVELGKETPVIFNPTMKDTENNISKGELTLAKSGKGGGKSRDSEQVTEETQTPHYLRWRNGVKGFAPHQHLQSAEHHEKRAAYYEMFPSRKEPYKKLPEHHRKMAKWHRGMMPVDFVNPTSDTKFKNTSTTEETVVEGDVFAQAAGLVTRGAFHGLKRMFGGGGKKRSSGRVSSGRNGPSTIHYHNHFGGSQKKNVSNGATVPSATPPKAAKAAKPAQSAQPAQPAQPSKSPTTGPWGSPPHNPVNATGPKIKQQSHAALRSSLAQIAKNAQQEKPRIRVKAGSSATPKPVASVQKPVDKPPSPPQSGKMSGAEFRNLLKKNPKLSVRGA
jgi:hypothetical protein